ncbi:MAG: hypothetical protein IT242_08925 [Bacteroidia bacterium]|nr:hypothetical protein [Bacteroidia bacterium]
MYNINLDSLAYIGTPESACGHPVKEIIKAMNSEKDEGKPQRPALAMLVILGLIIVVVLLLEWIFLSF